MTVAADVLLSLAVVAALIDWWGVARERVSVEFIAKPLVDIALIGTALAIDTPEDLAELRRSGKLPFDQMPLLEIDDLFLSQSSMTLKMAIWNSTICATTSANPKTLLPPCRRKRKSCTR